MKIHLLTPLAYSTCFLKVWHVLEDVEDCEQEKLAYIKSFPESNFGITHTDPAVRLIFLGGFAQIECEWGEPLSPTLSKWKKNPELVPCAELEDEVFLYFSQTFVDSFGVLPSVPHYVPTSISSQNPDVGLSYSKIHLFLHILFIFLNMNKNVTINIKRNQSFYLLNSIYN